MSNARKELISLMMEFILSIVVIVGGGLLLINDVYPEFVIASITTIIMFWFNQRDKERAVKQALHQQPPKDPDDNA